MGHSLDDLNDDSPQSKAITLPERRSSTRQREPSWLPIILMLVKNPCKRGLPIDHLLRFFL